MPIQPSIKAPFQASAPEAPDGLPTPQRYFAAATLILAIAIAVIDSNISNIALPTISQALGITPSLTVWVINAYTITIIATLLPFSALAEKIGFKRQLRIGIIIFMGGALLSMLSNNFPLLIIARIIQGIGCSAFMALFGSLVRNIYPHNKLAIGISINAMTVGTCALISPSLGAFILSITSWHWVYGFSIPFCFLALALSYYVPRLERNNKPFDYTSTLLNALAFGCFIGALDLLFTHFFIGCLLLAVSIGSAYFLYRRSQKQENALVPIDLFELVPFRLAVIVSSMSFTVSTIIMISLPFYFHHGIGFSTSTIGLLFSVWPVANLIIAPIIARLSNQYPASILAGGGNLIMFIGLLILILLPKDSSPLLFAVCLFISGFGFGFFQTPNNKALLLSAPRHRSNAVGGVQSTARLFGQCLGAALVALCFTIDINQPYSIIIACFVALLASLVNLRRYLNKSDVAIF